MIVLDLSILNQKGTPMFNSDTFANRPAFGIVGRIFISTDTKEFFRDTGTSWELIGGPGSGTITGSGAATQIAFWNSASTITGSNNLFWDSTNNYLGINTNVPTTALDVHHSTNSGAIFNQTTATNNNTINFQTSGSGRWRIGNFYTAGADDFGIFDVVGSLQQLTILKTTGQTFIGDKTTASGRLVVNSTTADAHLQVVGANSPSIRIDNAGSGGTQRFVFGLATATNNFIQGATAGQFCISTQSAGNILFGMWQTINASEVMRITTANNLIVGSTTDAGYKLDVNGTARVTGATQFGGNVVISLNQNASTNFNVTNTDVGINTKSEYVLVSRNGGTTKFGRNSVLTTAYKFINASDSYILNETLGDFAILNDVATGNIKFAAGGSSTAHLTISSTGNLGLGVTPSAWGSNRNAIQFGALGAVFSDNNVSSEIGANVYISTTPAYTYITSNFATRFTQINGQFQWQQAPSGTAGNAITFTQAMTLNANGNLLVGTTTDNGSKLQVTGAATFSAGLTSEDDTTIQKTTSSLRLFINNTTATTGRNWYLNSFSNGNLYIGNATFGDIFNFSSTGAATFSLSIAIGNSVAAAVAAPSTHKISILVGGVQYYLLASNV